MDYFTFFMIARYELKLLWRSWLFYILLFLSLSWNILIQLLLQADIVIPEWYAVALPSSLPFLNAYLFNITQSFMVIFIVTEWFRQEKTLNTRESTRVRPFGNTAYILGKSLGIWGALTIANLLSVLAGLYINLFASSSPVDVAAYIFYWLTLTFPSLVFMLGLSVFMARWLKNQIFSLLLLLIGTGFIVFFKPPYLLDYLARDIPNMFSEFTGHVYLLPYLAHRVIYLLSGMGLLVASISLYPRIPNTVYKYRPLRTGGYMVLAGIILATGYYLYQQRDDQFRRKLVNITRCFQRTPKTWLTTQDITLKQTGNKLEAHARFTVKNYHETTLDSVILYLNPGLEVGYIRDHAGTLPYTREEQVITLTRSLLPGDSLTLDMAYRGKIDERACYLDIPGQTYNDNTWEAGMFCFGKRHAFVGEEITLLLPECLWYPVTEPPVVPSRPTFTRQNFTRFSLNVIGSGDRQVISQGKVSRKGDTTRFENKEYLAGISLCSGKYTRDTLALDSLLLEVYFYKGRDIFTGVFSHLTRDDLSRIVKGMKGEIEELTGIPYPGKKLALVEVPVSFTSYYRQWQGRSDHVQPEMVFLPERGTTMPEFTSFFERNAVQGRKWYQKRGKVLTSPLKLETWQLEDFIRRLFMREIFEPRELSPWKVATRGKKVSGGRSKINMGDDVLEEESKSVIPNKYKLHSLFSTSKTNVFSGEYPVASSLFNALNDLPVTDMNYYYRYARGRESLYTGELHALDYLDGHSLQDAIENDTLSAVLMDNILKVKFLHLRDWILARTSFDKFRHFTRGFSGRHEYAPVSLERFTGELKDSLGVDCAPYLASWYSGRATGHVIAQDLGADKVETGDYSGYRARGKFYNPSDTEALVTFSTRGGGRYSHTFVIPPGEAIEIRKLQPGKPRCIYVYFHVSRNRPMYSLEQLYEPEIEKMITQSDLPSDIETTVNDSTSGLFKLSPGEFRPAPDEIIVDNEDKNFRLIQPEKDKLAAYHAQKNRNKDKYGDDMSFFLSPYYWTLRHNPRMHGDYIRGAYYKERGNGRFGAEWTVTIPKSGNYEVFVYNASTQAAHRGQPIPYQYFTVYYQGGKKKVAFPLKKGWDWVSIGTYPFTRGGKFKVTLDDRGSEHAQVIFADAIKWVRVENDLE